MLAFNPPALRIALVLHDFSGGGTERIAIRLANHWAGAGRRVTILCGTSDGPARELVGAGVDVVPMDPVIPRSASSRIVLGAALARVVDVTLPDVVISPGNFHAPVLRMMLARLRWADPATVCKISNPLRRPEGARFGPPLFTPQFGWATRRFDRLVAMSPSLASEAQKLLHRPGIPALAEPILPDDWIPPSRRNKSGLIVCAGRLTAQKDFTLALRSFALLPRSYRLVLLGDGEQRAMLEGVAAGLGIAGRVEFAGHVPDIAPWLAHADALLCSSRFEGYPAVLIEALGAGVPVVTTPCSPALAEIFADPSFGRVASPDPLALAQALLAVTEGDGPDRVALAAALGRHRAGAAADSWLALVDRAAESRRAALAA